MRNCNVLWLAVVALPIVCCNILMFDYGAQVGDRELTRELDAIAPVTLSTPLYFFNQKNTEVYIDSNGVIWPGWNCGYACDEPTPFPVQNGKQIVACYWADTDLTVNSNSHVYYRVATDFSTLLTANSLLQNAYGETLQFDTTSNSTVIIIATWVNVSSTGGNAATTNTFQCAVLSDGLNSYALFSYAELQWANSPEEMASNNPAIAGVDSGFANAPSNNFTLPLSHSTGVTNMISGGNFVKQGAALGWYAMSMAEQYIPYSYNLTGVSYKTCQANSDPHYITFDSLTVDTSFPGNPGPYVTQMQGSGNWIMVATADCKSSNYPPIALFVIVDTCNNAQPCPTCPQCPIGFKLQLFFDTAGIGKVPLPIEIEVYSSNFTVGGVQFTTSYTCPTTVCAYNGMNNYTFYINQVSNDGYILTSNFGLTVQFTSSNPTYGYVIVTLPYISALSGNIFGYCGNMDNHSDNDNFCWNSGFQNYQSYQDCWPESYLTNQNTSFGDGIYQCQRYPPTASGASRSTDDQPIAGIPDWAYEKCQVLIDPNGGFAQCQSVSNLAYTSCLLDMTSTNGDEDTFCADASYLAQMCAGLPTVTNLDWRTETFCPPQCLQNAHYSTSMTSCPSTCDSPYAPLFCSLPLTEGCICDDGFILENGQCIQIAQCGGCLNDVGIMVVKGTNWLSSDCAQTCTCLGNGQVSCVSTPCGNNAACAPIGTSHGCQCNAGYFGDGYSCTETDNCSPGNNCQNSVQCISKPTGYTCVCKAGYTGQYCTAAIDYCTSNPCVYGNCLSQIGGYTCNCSAGHDGINCDQKQNWCNSYPCTNLATCINLDNGYQCACQQGTTGQNCEIILPTTTTAATDDPQSTIPYSLLFQ